MPGNITQGAMRPLTVTALTPAGYASGTPWSPSLDGIMAWAAMRERLGRDFGTNLDLTAVEGLPLAVERHGGEWWYACGAPRPSEVLGQRDKHFHRRFNAIDAERWTSAKRIETAMGPHKNMRKAHFITTCASLSWACIGEPEEVLRLVEQVHNVGSGHTRGLGAVAGWRVTEGFDGPLLRAVPVAYAAEHGIVGSRGMHALRPPAHLPSNVVLCVQPG